MKKNLVAANNAGDSALGHLIWFSIGEMEITRKDIEALANNSNLPNYFLPPPIRTVDAFRRATTEVGGIIREKENVNETILVREVSSDKEGVVRHLIKETADKKNKRLNYDHCGTFKYDRERETMYGSAYIDEVEPMVERAKTLFEKYMNYYTAYHIRRMVKTVLAECSSIPLRAAGAVYFVPRKYEEKIRSLRDFMKSLPGNATEIHLMPVVDMEEQREMLEQKLRSHVTAEITKIGAALGGNAEILSVKHSLKSLASQFAETLKSNPEVSRTIVNNAVEQLQLLKGQVREYEALLETNLSEVRNTLEVLRSQVRTMLNRVESENSFFDLGAPVKATA